MTPNVQQRIRYDGSGRRLFGLVHTNALLLGPTLGIHYFWGKARVRAFHYNATEMSGERFVYHGTGGELLRGAILGGAVLMALSLAYPAIFNLAVPLALGIGYSSINMAATPGILASVAIALAGLLYSLLLLVLVAIAVNGARHYRLSRSSWHGVRFVFIGRWQSYVALTLRSALLDLVTLGFYIPVHQNRERAFLVNNARFGAQKFQYNADARPLFWAYVKALLLTVPTLGLSWVWYAAFRRRYFWGNTSINGARFRSTVTGGALLGLWVTNGLLLIVTLAWDCRG